MKKPKKRTTEQHIKLYEFIISKAVKEIEVQKRIILETRKAMEALTQKAMNEPPNTVES